MLKCHADHLEARWHAENGRERDHARRRLQHRQPAEAVTATLNSTPPYLSIGKILQ